MWMEQELLDNVEKNDLKILKKFMASDELQMNI